jgi:hypothetical protein
MNGNMLTNVVGVDMGQIIQIIDDLAPNFYESIFRKQWATAPRIP